MKKIVGLSNNGTFQTYESEYFYSALTVSTDEFIDSNVLAIFPNPTSNHTRIQLSEGQLSQVCIYDLSGQQVICQEDGELDLQSLKAGVYLVEVRTKNGGKIVDRLVKVD